MQRLCNEINYVRSAHAQCIISSQVDMSQASLPHCDRTWVHCNYPSSFSEGCLLSGTGTWHESPGMPAVTPRRTNCPHGRILEHVQFAPQEFCCAGARHESCGDASRQEQEDQVPGVLARPAGASPATPLSGCAAAHRSRCWSQVLFGTFCFLLIIAILCKVPVMQTS